MLGFFVYLDTLGAWRDASRCVWNVGILPRMDMLGRFADFGICLEYVGARFGCWGFPYYDISGRPGYVQNIGVVILFAGTSRRDVLRWTRFGISVMGRDGAIRGALRIWRFLRFRIFSGSWDTLGASSICSGGLDVC